MHPCRSMLFAAAMLSGLLSQPEAQERLTLDAARSIARERNSAVLSAEQAFSGAEARAREAHAVRFPEVSATARYARLSDIPDPSVTIPTATGGTQTIQISPVILDQYAVGASVTAPIFTGFRLTYAEEAAKNAADAARYDVQTAEQTVTQAVDRAYWNVYAARSSVKTVRETVRLMEAYRADVERLKDAGLRTQDDVLAVDVRLSEARVRELQTVHASDLAAASLANLLSMPPDTKLELADTPSEARGMLPPLDSLRTMALEQRPELLALERRVAALDGQIGATEGEKFPTVAVTAAYDYSRPNARIFPAKDEWRDTWSVGIGASWTVWDWRARDHRAAQARASSRQAVEQARGVRDRILLEVLSANLSVTDARDRIDLATTTVAQAEEHEQNMRRRFAAGTATTTEVLDTEVALERARLSRLQALVDWEVARADLDRAVGGGLQ